MKARRKSKSAAPAHEDQLTFVAKGELVLAREVHVPVELMIVSLHGVLPIFVDLKTTSSFGELALRERLLERTAELRVCGRQFRARFASRPKNSPLHRLHASDVFAALFPAVTLRKDDKHAA